MIWHHNMINDLNIMIMGSKIINLSIQMNPKFR